MSLHEIFSLGISKDLVQYCYDQIQLKRDEQIGGYVGLTIIPANTYFKKVKTNTLQGSLIKQLRMPSHVS
jgi:hypothetical protein